MTQGNKLLIGCGDRRLASLPQQMNELLGAHQYNLIVPGPDACVSGDEEHRQAVAMLAKRFLDLTSFEEIHVVVHEDCAGCVCSSAQHVENVWKMAGQVASDIGFTGDIFCYIARCPKGDQFVPWQIEKLEKPTTAWAEAAE